MARKNDAAAAKKKSRSVEEGTAEAAAGALGFAMHAAHESDPADTAEALNGLAALCDQAADHMALAHNLIAAHENHTETAIGHLDAALGCLKQIAGEGENRDAARTTAKRAGAAKNTKNAKSAKTSKAANTAKKPGPRAKSA